MRLFAAFARLLIPMAALQFGFGQQTTSADRAATAAPEPQPTGLARLVARYLQPATPGPLSERQRFQIYVESVIGPVAIFSEAASAAMGQAINSPSEWGQGGLGYARRFGNDIGFNALHNSLTYGTSILFREDNRYFAPASQTVAGRLKHVLLSPVTAERGGSETFSISGAAGIAGSCLISRAWTPPSWQGANNISRCMAFTYAGTAGLNAALEFVPGIVRRLHK